MSHSRHPSSPWATGTPRLPTRRAAANPPSRSSPAGGAGARSPATGPRCRARRGRDAQLPGRDVPPAPPRRALGNWHATHTRSPRSGEPTQSEQSGWVRRDPVAGSERFPRTDPAVIMAVVHTDTQGVELMLLGAIAMWSEVHTSLIVGFVM